MLPDRQTDPRTETLELVTIDEDSTFVSERIDPAVTPKLNY